MVGRYGVGTYWLNLLSNSSSHTHAHTHTHTHTGHGLERVKQ